MAKVDKAARLADAKLTRLKLHRGSTRRITRAATAIDTALAAFEKEMDLQFFKADEAGNRVGPCDFVAQVKATRAGIREAVNEMLHPPLDEDEDEDEGDDEGDENDTGEPSEPGADGDGVAEPVPGPTPVEPTAAAKAAKDKADKAAAAKAAKAT
jgi:hypothetical protein